jgi:hypothetical protein
METADTTQALRAALEAARRERDALTERISTVDQLIADLDAVIDGAGAGPARGRRTGKRTTRKASTAKRSSKKAAGKRSTKKATAKRAGRKATAKRGTRKGASRKATGKRAGRRPRRQAAGRTDRVVEIVRSASEPLSTGDVRSRLSQAEPDVSSKLVSAALTYAQRKGRVRRADGGRWTPA